MAVNSVQSTVCRQCGKPFDIEAPEAVNVAENPSLKEQIKDGTLFAKTCPHCGAVNLLRFRMLYHDPDGRLMLWLIPEDSLTPEDRGKLDKSMDLLWASLREGLQDYTFRRVPDPGALIEKVRIFDAGLEDTAIEMCKYVTAMELAQAEKDKAKAAALSEVKLRFRGLSGADNNLEFVFPLDGAMHSVNVGFNVYEDSRAILARNPSLTPDGPFPTVESVWLKEHFR